MEPSVEFCFETLNEGPFSEIELMNFERNHREILHELHRKRILLDESRQELNEMILKQHELQSQLESEKRKNENLQKEISLSNIASKKIEETRNEFQENYCRQKVELETSKIERDVLKEQTRYLQHENVKLKRQLEDLDSKYNSHLPFQRDLQEQQTRIKNIITQLASTNQTLRNEKEDLQKYENSIEVATQYKFMIKLCEEEKKKAIEEKDKIEERLIVKTAELESLKELLQNSPLFTEKENEEVLEYWMSTTKDLQNKLFLATEGNEKLTKALQEATNTIVQYEKCEKLACAKIDELENMLKQKPENKKENIEKDIDNLNKSFKENLQTTEDPNKNDEKVLDLK